MNVDNLYPSNSIMRDTLEGDPEVMAEATQEEQAEEISRRIRRSYSF